jgi:hypothetical protein
MTTSNPDHPGKTMRTIHTHQVTQGKGLAIVAIDQPGENANRVYAIMGAAPKNNPSYLTDGRTPVERLTDFSWDTEEHLGAVIVFQASPSAGPFNSPDGITMEALLAICADRLQSFQAGPYACTENADALTNINAALNSLHSRTRRIASQA